MRHFPTRVSRVIVLLGMTGCVTLTGLFWYARAIGGDPFRVSRDADGVLRLMTRAELLEARLVDARRRASVSPSDASLDLAVKGYEGALASEQRRLEAIGGQTRPPPKESDLTL